MHCKILMVHNTHTHTHTHRFSHVDRVTDSHRVKRQQTRGSQDLGGGGKKMREGF